MKMVAAIMLLTGVAVAESPPMIPLLPPEIMTHAEDALDAMVMTRADAGFDKNHGKPQWSLSWITNALNNPWEFPTQAENLFRAAEAGGALPLWNVAAQLMETGPAAQDVAVNPAFPDPLYRARLDSNLVSALEGFLLEATRAAHILKAAFADVSAEERQYLAAGLLVPALETEDVEEMRTVLINAGIPRPIQERVEAEGRKLDGTTDALAGLALLKKIHFPALWFASRILQEAATKLAENAAGITLWPDDPVSMETDFGPIIIGSTKADRHEGPSLLVLDPGGDDLYLEGPGAANGLLNVFLSVIVDVAGHDHYRGGFSGAGSSLWGISVVHDREGNDLVSSAGPAAGTALFGGAWHEDGSGHDTYRGRLYSQGAGVAGFGFLVDHAGDDDYAAGFYSQGFSSTMGWGLLLDRDGHDRYFAGNDRRDHERNDDRFLSLAQGFSIGLRPHAGGGVGALMDLAGNDTYIADIYGQGVSYYYSAGFLLDRSGNDRYVMYQYGQGCGIHMSLGLLADAQGDDTYSGYILAQGAAHDYAVGMLFDHQGHDTYTADHHAQGRALNNAFALLVDRDGTDAYFGRQRDGAQGIGNNGGFRDYGSLALLLDLAGNDVYSGGFSNATTTIRPLYGVVHDLPEEARP